MTWLRLLPSSLACGLLAAAVLFVTGSAPAAHAQTVDRLESPNPRSGGFYGFSVDLDATANEFMVGAYKEGIMSDPFQRGRAYIYGTPVTGSPFLEATLNPPGLQIIEASSEWGRSVAVGTTFFSDNVYFVGAPRDDDTSNPSFPVTDSGSWSRFAFDGSAYSRIRTREITPTGSRLFGFSLDLDDNTLAASTILNDQNIGYNDGRVYIRKLAPMNGGSNEAIIETPNPQKDAQFGRGLALDGDRLVVTAPNYDTGGLTNRGDAYVFLRDTATSPPTWNQEQRLVPTGLTDGAQYGRAAALAGDLAFVSASAQDVGGTSDAGAVYVWARDPATGTWANTQTLTALTPESGSLYGYDLDYDASTGRLYVGAPREDAGSPTSLTDAGAVYVYEPDAVGTLRFELRLISSQPQADALYGASLSADGDKLVVGAYNEDVSDGSGGTFADAGAVYSYPSLSGFTTTYYVDGATGNDANSGETWASAYATLTQALSVATGSDEIWIAEGTYTPTSGTDRTASFTITGDQDGLEIYGGFENGDANLSDRNPTDHPVILSGDIGTPGNPTDNSYHVLFLDGGTGSGIGTNVAANVTPATVLDGVTVTGGNADDMFPNNIGGGLLCDGNGFSNTCSPVLTGVIFTGNKARFGGAIYNNGDISGESSPVLINVIFNGNEARFGGAVYNNGASGTSSPVITNATFTGNRAATGGSARGGAIFNNGTSSGASSPAITNTILWGNTTTGSGPEIFNDAATPTIAHSIVQGSGGSASWDTSLGTDDGNNLDADPLFLDADGADGVFGTGDDDVRLLEASPAVDAGDTAAVPAGVTSDAAGNARIQDAEVDLGALEGGVTLTYYVDGATGNDANSGETWASAFATLTQALSVANSSGEIWIAEGTYTPTSGTDRTASFTITGDQDGLEIYGGFENGDANLSDRNPTDHPVILSGDIGTPGDASDNSYHVLFLDGGTGVGIGTDVAANVTPATVLDGVTVTGGNADGTFPDNIGGGLLCDGNGSTNTCSPTLTGVTFTSHKARIGGAIYNNGDISGESSPVITNAIFTGNQALSGGAIYNNGNSGTSSPVITNATFTGNSAAPGGSARGGALLSNGNSSPVITNTILWGNTTTGSGPEIFNQSATPTIAHSIVQGSGGSASWDTNLGTDDGNNLDTDPLFLDADGADGVFGTSDDDVRLFTGSPAVDAGDTAAVPAGVTSDAAGNARIQDGVVDLGALEGGVPGAALTYFVDGTNGDDTNAGDGWATAYATLTQALSVADGNDQVWIAEGTYTPTSGTDRTASFTITGDQDGLRVYGGFENGDANLSDRSPTDHPVILSGDIGTLGDAADNSYHVLVFDGGGLIGPVVADDVTPATVLDGVTVTGGNANGPSPGNLGGGLLCDGRGPGNVCSPTLVNVVFSNNATSVIGGAMFNDAFDGGLSSPVITNATFVNNESTFDGGAIYNQGRQNGTSSPVITNAVFVGNTAGRDGGALYNAGRDGGRSDPQITNVTFTDNEAARNGGAIMNFRAASPRIDNTILWDNTAATAAAGPEIFNFTGSASPTVTHTLIQGGISSTYSGGDNFDADPLFADASTPAGPDGVFGTVDDGLTLTSGSPALDAGDNALLPADAADLDGDGDTAEAIPFDRTGNVRIVDNDPDTAPTVDVGAYEAPSGIVLPVELASFAAQASGQAVTLTWQTLTETANAGFAVEQHEGSGSWREVAFVAGAGTTTERQTYRHEMANVPYGAHAFRLRQVDFDGTATPSQEVEVTVELAEAYALAAYPNPVAAGQRARIDVTTREAQQVTVALYDVLGRRVAVLFDGEMAASATERLALPARGLASGVYVVRAVGERFTATRRVTVVR